MQRDADCAANIKEYTNNELKYVFDTIAIESSAKISAEALSSKAGGKYTSLLSIDCPRPDVESKFFLGYTSIGEAFEFDGEIWPAKPEDHEFAVSFVRICEGLLANGKFKGHPP